MALRNQVKAALLKYADRAIGKKLKSARDIYERAVLQETVARQLFELAERRGYSAVDRYEMVYAISRQLQPEFSMNDHGRTFLRDEEFRDWFVRFNGANFRMYERRWMVKQTLRLVSNVSGDLAECGVFEGASAYQLCQFAKKHGRHVHLFDSFQGLSEPSHGDGDFWWLGALSASEEKVRENLKEFDCFETFKGWIPERFPDVTDRRYSFGFGAANRRQCCVLLSPPLIRRRNSAG